MTVSLKVEKSKKPAKIKYDSKERKKTEDLKNMRAENLLELRLQKYKTYGLYFLISIMLIGSSYIYYYLKAK
jgi:hypothetical protein